MEQIGSVKMFVWNNKTNGEDIVGMKCIRGKDRNIKVRKMKVLKEYREKLINIENG